MTAAVTFPYRGKMGVFNCPEARVREYTEIEVYEAYDAFHNSESKVTESDINAARCLYAWPEETSMHRASQDAMKGDERIRECLSETRDSYLGDIGEQDYQETRTEISALVSSFMSIDWVGPAVATKILHLHKPNLIPIIDSHVLLFLTGTDTQNISKSKQVDLVLYAIDVIWKNLRANRDVLGPLSQDLGTLQFPLTKLRIHDILTWTLWTWDIKGKAFGCAEKGRIPVRTLGCWKV